MKQAKITIGAFLLLNIGFFHLQAQNVTTAVGGNATGTGGSISYSVGQLAYNYTSSSAASVSEGVQQPYEISVITGTQEVKEIALSYFVYPNPTVDYLTLKIGNYRGENLSYNLYGIDGRVFKSNTVTGSTQTISLENLAVSTYFLAVMDDKKELKIFKIIKQ